MGYVVAAYLVVIGALVGYGLWMQAQRRGLMRRARERDRASDDATDGERASST